MMYIWHFEAVDYQMSYHYTGKNPDAEVLREFQMLFTDRKKYPTPPDSLKHLMEDSGCYEKCYNYYKNHKFCRIDRA